MGDVNTGTQQSGLSNPAMQAAATTIGNQLNTQLGAGVKPYTTSMVPDLSSQTTAGINSLMGAAGNTGGITAANDWARGVVGSSGYNPALTGALDTTNAVGGQFGSMASGLSGQSAAEKGFTGLYNKAGGQSLTESELMGVAQGDAFGTNDPGYAALRAKAGDDTLRDVNAMFTTSGRFGSGSHVKDATESLGSVYANMDYQNYQNDIARQERALGAIEGMRQQGFANQAGALGSADAARLAQIGARSNALSGQLGAAQGAAGIGQTAMGNAGGAAAALPGFYQAGLMPGGAMLQAGQIQDTYNTAKAQDDARIWDATNNANWNTLQRGGSIFSGTAPVSGTTGTTTQSQQVPWWQTGLGIGAGLLSFM